MYVSPLELEDAQRDFPAHAKLHKVRHKQKVLDDFANYLDTTGYFERAGCDALASWELRDVIHAYLGLDQAAIDRERREFDRRKWR